MGISIHVGAAASEGVAFCGLRQARLLPDVIPNNESGRAERQSLPGNQGFCSSHLFCFCFDLLFETVSKMGASQPTQGKTSALIGWRGAPLRLVCHLSKSRIHTTPRFETVSERFIFTESQLAALEKAKAEKEVQGEFETECPGYCGAQDIFHVGTLKGVGRSIGKPLSIPMRRSASPNSTIAEHRLRQ
jgi:hypothetical protein